MGTHSHLSVISYSRLCECRARRSGGVAQCVARRSRKPRDGASIGCRRAEWWYLVRKGVGEGTSIAIERFADVRDPRSDHSPVGCGRRRAAPRGRWDLRGLRGVWAPNRTRATRGNPVGGHMRLVCVREPAATGSVVADVVEAEPSARASSSALTAAVMARVKGTSWCTACTWSCEVLRSAVASTLPTSRSWCSTGSAKYPQRRLSFGLYISRVYSKSNSSMARTRSWISRSNGDSSAVRPSKPSAVASGSTRHRPVVPSISAGMPARRRPRAGDAQGPQPLLVADPAGLLRRHHRHVGRVDPLGQVPQALPATAAGDGDLTAGREELEHLGDVAVVRPTRRLPRHLGGVGDVARGQRARGAQQVEHPPAEPVVGGEPLVAPGQPNDQAAMSAR